MRGKMKTLIEEMDEVKKENRGLMKKNNDSNKITKRVTKLVLETRKRMKTLMKEIGEIKKENRVLKKKNKDSKQLLKQKIEIIEECCNRINMFPENM